MGSTQNVIQLIKLDCLIRPKCECAAFAVFAYINYSRFKTFIGLFVSFVFSTVIQSG